jgi:hypothetical protein
MVLRRPAELALTIAANSHFLALASRLKWLLDAAFKGRWGLALRNTTSASSSAVSISRHCHGARHCDFLCASHVYRLGRSGYHAETVGNAGASHGTSNLNLLCSEEGSMNNTALVVHLVSGAIGGNLGGSLAGSLERRLQPRARGKLHRWRRWRRPDLCLLQFIPRQPSSSHEQRESHLDQS